MLAFVINVTPSHFCPKKSWAARGSASLLLSRLLGLLEGFSGRSAFASGLTHRLAAPGFDALPLSVNVGVQTFLLSHYFFFFFLTLN